MAPKTLKSRFASCTSLYDVRFPCALLMLSMTPSASSRFAPLFIAVPPLLPLPVARQEMVLERWTYPKPLCAIVPLSNFVPRGFGFVHHSIAILYHQVPNPYLTIRNFFFAVGVPDTPRTLRGSTRFTPDGSPAQPSARKVKQSLKKLNLALLDDKCRKEEQAMGSGQGSVSGMLSPSRRKAEFRLHGKAERDSRHNLPPVRVV
jgi:hypothetical protein